MNKLNVYKTKLTNYKHNLDSINQGLGKQYAAGQTRLNRVKDEAWRRNNKFLIESLENSQYGRAMAAGKTGKSIARMGVMEAAKIGRFYARSNAAITDANEDFMTGVRTARDKAKLAQRQEFSQVWIPPQASIAPPRPVYQNVGWAMIQDALGIASTGASMAASFPR